jgi:hypothetical protein
MPEVQEVFRMATQKVRPDPGALERQNQSQRRRSIQQRVGGYAVVAIITITALLIAVFAIGQREERPASQREQPSAGQLATQPYFLDLDTGETTLLPGNLDGGYSYVASPDGTKLAFGTNVSGGCGRGDVVKVADIDGTNVRTIQPPEGFSNCAPRWSPDGAKLVYQERPATNDDVGYLVVHDLATGDRTQITDLDRTRAFWYYLSPSFSHHSVNDEVIFHMPRSSGQTTSWDVWSVPATGGEPRLMLRDASWPMTNPSPNGDVYAVQFLEPSANDLVGQSIMTGHPCCRPSAETLVEATEGIWWPTMSPDGNRIAYHDGGSIYVLEIVTGESAKVADGFTAEWLDFDTLIVTP